MVVSLRSAFGDLAKMDSAPAPPSPAREYRPRPCELPFEVHIEYCTKTTFHTKHRPEKYARYFATVRAAMLSIYSNVRVVANPVNYDAGKGHRSWRIEDHLKPLENISFPRLGAFEVNVVRNASTHLIFSKLESGCWPNADILIDRVEHVLQNVPISVRRTPVPPPPRERNPSPPLPGVNALKVRRHLPTYEPRVERSWKLHKVSVDKPVPVRDLRELSAKLYRRDLAI